MNCFTDVRSYFSKYRGAPEKTVVFTNGCFDLLHPGHVRVLGKSRALGDHLVVGLNSDRSVRRLKGPDRPVHRESDRAEVLLALQSVDAVILFDEDTPERLIRELRPDILTKGGDYQRDDIVGADFVESTGGRVVVLPYETGHSTSALIRTFRENRPA